MENIAIIYNPNAGQNRKQFLNQVLTLLGQSNIKFNLFATEYPGHATKLAKMINTDAEFSFIVAAGGDGTINEVINGLYGSDKPLGIVPLGTVNVLAREIGLKITPEGVVETLIKKNMIDIFPTQIDGRYFSLMASVGVDARSVKNVNLKLKKIISKSAYIFSFFWEAIKSNYYSHTIKINEVDYISYCSIIAKGKLYAGSYICAPNATIKDKYVHVVMLKKKGVLALFKFFLAILQNNIAKIEQVEIIKTNSLSIFSDYEEAIQIDGDYYGQLPVNISVSDKAIKLIVPA